MLRTRDSGLGVIGLSGLIGPGLLLLCFCLVYSHCHLPSLTFSAPCTSLNFKKLFYISLFTCMHMAVWADRWVGVGTHTPPNACGSWKATCGGVIWFSPSTTWTLGMDCQVWRQVPLFAESSCWPMSNVLNILNQLLKPNLIPHEMLTSQTHVSVWRTQATAISTFPAPFLEPISIPLTVTAPQTPRTVYAFSSTLNPV